MGRGSGGGDHRVVHYPLYRSNELRGAGIGSVFTNVLKGVVPLIRGLFRTGAKIVRSPAGQATLKKAKKAGLKAGVNLVNDTLKGENVLKSAKRRSKQAVTEFGNEMLNAGKKQKKKTRAKGVAKSRNKKAATTATPAAVIKRAAQRKQRPANKDIFS